MRGLFAALRESAASRPQSMALEGAGASMRYGELELAAAAAAGDLAAREIRALGLFADNGVPWALADLAALAAEIPLVPMPLFFSSQQLLHVARDAGLDALLTDRPDAVEALLSGGGVDVRRDGEVCGLHLIRLQGLRPRALPQGTAKITYTSGTTGEPKGVCLSARHIEAVAVSLRDASGAQAADRHLCLTPLSTLLENIGGIYTPLLAGACACLPPLRQVGLDGASRIDAVCMLLALHENRASSAIVAPQMLHALVAAGEAGRPTPPGLRFVAVGGAPLSPQLLARAHGLGIPAFEGYGLSECASVVALNTPDASRPGSVGRPLPHLCIEFTTDGEILVGGPAFLGYLGQASPSRPWPTGDLGYLDADGFLYLTGRRNSRFITSFGRNVAPEWVERELGWHPAIAQAAVFGEARPFNVAVIVPGPGFSRSQVDAALAAANRTLPDYARVACWVPAGAPFAASNGQATANGRLKREAISAAYAGAIASLYQQEETNVFL